MRSWAFVRKFGVGLARLCLALVGALAGCRGAIDTARGDLSGAGGTAGSDGTTGAGGARRATGTTTPSRDGGATVADAGTAGNDGAPAKAMGCNPGETRCVGGALSSCARGAWGPALSCGTRLTCADGGTTCVGVSDGLARTTGTWTPLKRQYLATSPSGAPAQPGTAQLLTDGRVLASGPETSNAWYTFTPDALGSYENGTWAHAASSPAGRLFHPSFVLRDGRYWTGGGEYLVGSTSRAESELYDPATDTWTVLPDMPQEIADTPAAVLGDGRLLVLSHLWSSTNTYILAPDGVPAWSLAARWSNRIGDPESSSITLQDGSVLVGSRLFQIYHPWSDTWIDAAVPPGGAGAFEPPKNDEMGPILMLHDGRALVTGSNQKAALFTAGGPNGAGSWTAVADTPAPYNHSDAPAIVEPDGKVLSIASTTGDEDDGDFTGVFYEYDPDADTWTLIPAPFTLTDVQRVVLLALPNGQIWASGPGSATAWLYTPAGTPRAAWRPSLGGLAVPAPGAFTLTGARLGGLTTGGDMGDDAKMATNFPIVSFTDGAGHVYYGRSFGLDDMTPGHCTSATVVAPSAIPDGTYAVHVAANGVREAVPGQVTFAGPRVAALAAQTAAAPGQDAAATVTLTAPAPAGGTTVQLSSSDAGVAGVPPSLVVPAGATSASFLVHCAAAAGSATLKAATANSPAFAASQVFGWSVKAVSGPSALSDGTAGPWLVDLDHAAPAGGVAVDLTSTNTALVTVPSRVTVPEGQREIAFSPTVVDPTAGTGRIYAALPGSVQSGSFGWTVKSVAAPASTGRNTSATWTVSISGPAPVGGLFVSLSSTNLAIAAVPSSVTVPAGQTSATFPVDVVADPSTTTTYVTASFGASYVMTPVH
jgi:hypothetical protein